MLSQFACTNYKLRIPNIDITYSNGSLYLATCYSKICNIEYQKLLLKNCLEIKYICHGAYHGHVVFYILMTNTSRQFIHNLFSNYHYITKEVLMKPDVHFW